MGSQPTRHVRPLRVGAMVNRMGPAVLGAGYYGSMRCTWLLLLVGCGSEEEERTAPSNVGCNGSVENCELRVDEVRFLKTHNSHASLDRGYHEWAANHVEAIPTQLADGVRSLNVDVYEGDEGLITCHGLCELGSQPLVEVFTEIETFLTSNPALTRRPFSSRNCAPSSRSTSW